jgi:hypothetical protein
MGRYKSKNPTVSKGFSMKPDVLEMLKEQSDAAGLPMSTYLERLILEKHYMAMAQAHPEDSSDFK